MRGGNPSETGEEAKRPTILMMTVPPYLVRGNGSRCQLRRNLLASLSRTPRLPRRTFVSVEFMMIAVWVGMSTGLTSNFSRAMGAGEETKLQQDLKASWTLVLLCIPVFLLLGVFCWVFAGRLAPDPEVARQFAIYGSVLVAGSALTLFWSVIPDSIVKAHGDTKATLGSGIWFETSSSTSSTDLHLLVSLGPCSGIAYIDGLGRVGG